MTHRFVFAALALALLAPAALAQTPDAAEDPDLLRHYQASITPSELAGHLYVYADDYMAGRDTGEPGQRFAAKYLAGQYATMGIAPKGRGAASNYGVDSYLQPFSLKSEQLVSMTYSATRDGESVLSGAIPAASGGMVDLIPYRGSVSDSEAAPIVWVGDGSNLDGVDLAGAYAMGAVASQGGMRALTETLSARGVKGIILPAGPTAAQFQGFVGRLMGPQLSMASGEEDGPSPVVMLTGMDIASRLMGESATMAPEAMSAMPVGPTGTMLSVDMNRNSGMVETENVIAFIEGSDPDLKDEVVVLSAHLDHVGDDGDGEDMIYNGADDDGSGTVTLLEIAEAFHMAKAEGNGPRRSILFLHVTGEEKGLFGSAYYTDVDPVLPIENTVANLNIDMIGRYDPERGFETTDYVYIIGGDLISQDIHDWNATVNDVTGTGLLLSDRFNSPDDPNQFFRRSDHWNFGKYDVPFIFYFTGTHADYHGVGDSADKIDYDRMASIGRLIFGTAWHIANTDERPAVSGDGFN